MLITEIADQHIVAGTTATLQFQGVDSNGEPANPGTVTVSVVNSAGTAILTDEDTTVDGTARTVDLTADQTAAVDQLTATWSVSGTVIGTTVHDVVGRALISFAEYQLREPGKVSTLEKFLKARREVDDLVRERCNRSFVERLDIESIESEGTAELYLKRPDLIEVVWATDENGSAIDVSSVPPDGGRIARLIGSSWPPGAITIAYRHGKKRPPDDFVGAVAKAITAVAVEGTGIMSTRIGDGAVGGFIPRAGYGRAIYAIDEVDEVLNAHKWDPVMA